MKTLLIAEEKPVVTRFWMFASCVRTLLLLQCLNLPADFLKVSKGTPTDENTRRIQRFLAYLRSEGTPSELRVACLCLRLTDISLNVSATSPDEWSLAQGVRTPYFGSSWSGGCAAKRFRGSW